MDHILFAIPHNATLESREGARGRVARQFGGDLFTTRLVGVKDFGRLYAMDYGTSAQAAA